MENESHSKHECAEVERVIKKSSVKLNGMDSEKVRVWGRLGEGDKIRMERKGGNLRGYVMYVLEELDYLNDIIIYVSFMINV